MLRILSDENFNGITIRRILQKRPEIDLVRAHDLGLSGAADPEVLARAADEGRILLTHDRATVPPIAWQRVAAGLPMPGVFVLEIDYPVGASIDQILLLDSATDPDEWDGRIVYLSEV